MKHAAIVTRQLVKTTGAARNTHEQIRYLKNNGFQVDVYAEFINKEAVLASGGNPVKVFNLPLKNFARRKLFQRQVEKKLSKKKYDLIFGHGDIIHQDVLFLHNCVDLAYEILNDKPTPEDHEMSRIHGEILKSQKFKLLVANSHKMKTDVEKRFQIPESKIEVVHPGYDPQQFSGSDARHRASFRSSLGISEDKCLIGLVTSGNFKKRNVSLFLDSVHSLTDELKEKCSFLIVGKESNLDNYLKQCENLNIKELVHFIDPIKDVETIFQALDIFVLPALWEEFGRVVLEAMSCQLPVITSDQVGASELLEAHSQEFIFPSTDKGRLTHLLQQLIQNKDLRKDLGQVNRQTALKYTEQKQAEKLNAALLKHGLLD